MVHAVPQGPVGPAAGAADELAALVQGEHVAANAGELPTDEVAVLATPGQVEAEGVHEGGADDEQPQLVTEGLKVGDKYVSNGITKLSDQMEIVPITPERYQQKIQEQAKAMSAGDIVGAMKK